MDELDTRLVALLKRNGRATLSELAADLGVQRSTVRSRMTGLEDRGEIIGYAAMTRADVADHPIRGLMMMEIAGRGADKIGISLRKMPEVTALHSTNGTWDMIAEIGTHSLEAFDDVLTRIRRLEAITRSETSLLLSTRR